MAVNTSGCKTELCHQASISRPTTGRWGGGVAWDETVVPYLGKNQSPAKHLLMQSWLSTPSRPSQLTRLFGLAFVGLHMISRTWSTSNM